MQHQSSDLLFQYPANVNRSRKDLALRVEPSHAITGKKTFMPSFSVWKEVWTYLGHRPNCRPSSSSSYQSFLLLWPIAWRTEPLIHPTFRHLRLRGPNRTVSTTPIATNLADPNDWRNWIDTSMSVEMEIQQKNAKTLLNRLILYFAFGTWQATANHYWKIMKCFTMIHLITLRDAEVKVSELRKMPQLWFLPLGSSGHLTVWQPIACCSHGDIGSKSCFWSWTWQTGQLCQTCFASRSWSPSRHDNILT